MGAKGKGKMKEFTREDIRMLAEVERDMDAGRRPFVVVNGRRAAMTPDAMREFRLETGQTITNQIMITICEFNLAECGAKIAERDAAKISDEGFTAALDTIAREDLIPGSPE